MDDNTAKLVEQLVEARERARAMEIALKMIQRSDDRDVALMASIALGYTRTEEDGKVVYTLLDHRDAW